MTEKRIRIGVIGCGGIAQMMHLPHLQALNKRFELSAISDLSQGLLTFIGERYQVAESQRYLNYHDLVKAPVDAVLVLSAGNHAAAVLAAVNAGKHVFVEKPMCFTLAEADQIIAAAKAANVKLMVGYMKRYDPGYRYAQQLIQRMADIRYVQINTLHPAEDDYLAVHDIVRGNDIPQEVLEPLIQADDAQVIKAVGQVSPGLRNLYAGLFLGSMVHDTNALRGLLGEPEQVLFSELWPANSSDVSVTTVLQYPNNIRVTYTWTYLPALRDYFQELAVMSSDQRVRIQFPSPYLRHFPTPVVIQGMEEGAAYSKRIEVSHAEAFKEELLAFHNSISHNTQPLTNAEEARGDIVLLQQIFAALAPEGLAGEASQYIQS